jgi:RNA polymerase sigma factor (sigma-70 family)
MGSMTDQEAVTLWLKQLADGNESAIAQLWTEYCDKLLRVARQKLHGAALRVADEEDVALSAIHSFCRGVAAGRYPKLDDRHDLWKILITITARKAFGQLRRQKTQKRGGGEVRGESVFARPDGAEERGIEQVLGSEPSPEFAALFTEESERRLAQLDDETLRDIALMKMESYTNEEIAEKLECSVRTVERKLERIRAKWLQDDGA